MRHIVRAVYEKTTPRLLVQGDYIEDYVDPATVRVFAVWTNFAGEDMVGPEMVANNKVADKLANRTAIFLTKLIREHSNGADK